MLIFWIVADLDNFLNSCISGWFFPGSGSYIKKWSILQIIFSFLDLLFKNCFVRIQIVFLYSLLFCFLFRMSWLYLKKNVNFSKKISFRFIFLFHAIFLVGSAILVGSPTWGGQDLYHSWSRPPQSPAPARWAGRTVHSSRVPGISPI